MLQRFPTERRAIEQLATQSEDFCDMCEELADAELGLRAARMLPSDIRGERTAEWTGLINRLLGEIAKALQQANVNRIGQARRRL